MPAATTKQNLRIQQNYSSSPSHTLGSFQPAQRGRGYTLNDRRPHVARLTVQKQCVPEAGLGRVLERHVCGGSGQAGGRAPALPRPREVQGGATDLECSRGDHIGEETSELAAVRPRSRLRVSSSSATAHCTLVQVVCEEGFDKRDTCAHVRTHEAKFRTPAQRVEPHAL